MSSGCKRTQSDVDTGHHYWLSASKINKKNADGAAHVATAICTMQITLISLYVSNKVLPLPLPLRRVYTFNFSLQLSLQPHKNSLILFLFIDLLPFLLLSRLRIRDRSMSPSLPHIPISCDFRRYPRLSSHVIGQKDFPDVFGGGSSALR